MTFPVVLIIHTEWQWLVNHQWKWSWPNLRRNHSTYSQTKKKNMSRYPDSKPECEPGTFWIRSKSTLHSIAEFKYSFQLWSSNNVSTRNVKPMEKCSLGVWSESVFSVKVKGTIHKHQRRAGKGYEYYTKRIRWGTTLCIGSPYRPSIGHISFQWFENKALMFQSLCNKHQLAVTTSWR
jgi:hypothetical protein